MNQPHQFHSRKARWIKTGQDVLLQWESGIYPNRVYVYFGDSSSDGSGYIPMDEIEFIDV